MGTPARRHHFLPQFLQAGFACRSKVRERYVWLHRRDCQPVVTNTKNVAVERDYHLSSMLSNAEARIGAFETRFAPLVRTLRAHDAAPQPSEQVTQFMRHLFLRLPRCREFLHGFVRPLVGAITEVFLDRPMRPVRHRNLQSALDGAMAEARRLVETQTLAHNEVADRLQAMLMAELPDLIYNQALRGVQSFMANFDLAGLVRDNHTARIVEEIQVKHLGDSEMSWRAVPADAPLVLGDVGPLGLSVADDSLVAFDLFQSGVRSIVLPIAHDRLLIGERSMRSRVPSASEWNQASSRLSKEFFLAGHSDDETTSLRGQIGTEYRIPSLDDILKLQPQLGTELVCAFRESLRPLSATGA